MQDMKLRPPMVLPTNGSGRNGRIGILAGAAILTIVLSIGASYFSGRLAVSRDLGDRPLREEVERKIDRAQMLIKQYTDAQQKAIMRELTSLQGDVKTLQSTLNKVLLQLRIR